MATRYTLTDTVRAFVSAAGRALLSAADAAAQRAALGLGGASTLDVGTTEGTVAAGNDPRFSGAGVPGSRTISAGGGLSGGGDLTEDRTLEVDTTTIATRSYAEEAATTAASSITTTTLGAVPVGRALAGLDLSSDRSAADLKGALAVEAGDVSGLGSLATQSSVAADSQLSGQVPVANGGTGSSSEVGARAALGIQDGPRLIPLFPYTTTSDLTPVVQALAGFTPSDYAIAGRTTVLTLDAIGSVTSGSQTGTLELLNAAGSVVATLTWTETTPTRKTASIALPGSAEIYRARVSCAGVVNPLTDYALIGGAHVRTTWS